MWLLQCGIFFYLSHVTPNLILNASSTSPKEPSPTFDTFIYLTHHSFISLELRFIYVFES